MIKTAECVTPKHPDKMADQISDAILDLCLKQDPKARVAVEVLGGHGKVVVMGEVTLDGKVTDTEVKEIVSRVTGKNGLEVETRLVQQSKEIANGVDTGGAGDQGIMIGYACTDNDAMIPQEAYLAKSLCKFLYEKFPYDGKTQITLNDKEEIETIVASFQNASQGELIAEIGIWISKELPKISPTNKIHANPAGDWSIGGFDADTGLTGRKIIVDAYGPQVAVGGGAFSGKDATKVDRSGAYMARKMAIDTMLGYRAKECLVKLAYAIGLPHPVMAVAFVTDQAGVTTIHELGAGEGTAKYLTPKGIIEYLELDKPQYEETARWGHFGNGTFKWDK